MRQIVATRHGDKSPRLHCCCNKALHLFGHCDISHEFKPVLIHATDRSDRSQRQNCVAATIIFTCHTGRFVAVTCRSDLSHCVSRPLSIKIFNIYKDSFLDH